MEVKNLSTEFITDQGMVKAVRDVSFQVEQGEVLGAVEMDEEILDISAAGNYVSVLFDDRVVIYTRKMEFYAEHELSRITHIFQQDDGTVLAVGDTKAFLVMP